MKEKYNFSFFEKKEKRNNKNPIEHISASKPRCLQSDPANPHTLCRRYDPPLSICFTCKGHNHLKDKKYYYYCATCDLEFHRGCHYYPSEIKHPFHLLHPLTLTLLNPSFDLSEIPHSWAYDSSDSESYADAADPVDQDSTSDESREKCKSCGTNLDAGPAICYRCSICNFNLDLYCAFNPPPLTIENPKTHDHTLTLLPRKLHLPCDACGFSLDARNDSVFSCLLCNYMVHRRCIYLPRVIKITRHQHRLSYTSSVVVPTGDKLSCGVCRKVVDVNYGQYSCIKGCHYAVHSKCATKKEVWDGKDLEGVPEKVEEDIEPFVRIDEETIQHFSHDHHYLKVHHGNCNRRNHENKFCQACTLPITVSDSFYSCVQCDFVLHETCSCLPRIIHHPLHKHPLTLSYPFYPKHSNKGFFRCSGCNQDDCGFMYKCRDCNFFLDARCALLPDPLIHDCHPHELFINLTRGRCMVCKTLNCAPMFLECIECELFLGLKCATLPCVAHYKHDNHPLTLCCGEEETTDLQYWCEICETTLDATKWFYTCNSCRVTLHIECLLGSDVYMKPNHIIKIDDEKVDIARNSGNSRPLCDGCKDRCVDTLVFKWLDKTMCSLYCAKYQIRLERDDSD
ncbi:DC1 [Arabidopsis thaliana x Arabidopsis arenosa]|uniref:DC1 n=1 Tax=Arabidopsis thaliana x Arabidopsis arenosa TaxID=1240361 RepID=A0A8T1XH80_9BRAS|nr:DC1 [Arabidopsis thaliana x Arabidopsis arenosa]